MNQPMKWSIDLGNLTRDGHHLSGKAWIGWSAAEGGKRLICSHFNGARFPKTRPIVVPIGEEWSLTPKRKPPSMPKEALKGW
jgi:hypothetical protein